MSSNENASPKEESSMDQVRELLFGTQVKEMDSRLQRQEERIERSISNVNSTLNEKLTTLESFMKSEINSVLTKLNQEQEERSESLKKEQKDRGNDLNKIVEQFNSSIEEINRKFNKMATTLNNTERELRELLLTESNKLSTNIQSRYEDCIDALSSAVAEINDDMVHRNQLSNMFTEVALKLSGQLDVGETNTPK